ncbi:Uncharacterized protein HZ326_27227 [Fusarium oxysporum f. sp. albedinis]|nr:Uncharacterized protein HZ326_27227 [Fusarium oxysporum f. sp. albedinis]KAK2470805.1 hypothetical protein H9L39_17036 [Fusarium oxysporum f. sp. albedinis]
MSVRRGPLRGPLRGKSLRGLVWSAHLLALPSVSRVNTWLTEGNAMKKPTRVVSSKIGIVMVAETYSGEDRERQQRRVAPDTSRNQDQGGNPLDNSPWAVDNNGDEVRLASSNYTRLKSTDIATNSSRLTSFPAKISRSNCHPQH